ncbi:MAG: endonuclease V [Candidatus Acetothermia bacterium]
MESSIREKLPDLYSTVLELLLQIPSGYVTTYKNLAKALGDQKASRAIGTIMASNPSPDVYPCWRVVHSDGRVGKYSTKGGQSEKIAKLNEDGIEVKRGRIVNFEDRNYQDFELDQPLPRCRVIQRRVARVASSQSWNKKEIGSVAGVDISYEDRNQVGAYVEFDLLPRKDKDPQFWTTCSGKTTFPYIPTYLAFRELQLLQKLLTKVRQQRGLADVVLVDGNGQLHPRRSGLASHLGVNLDHPTVGVAKALLCGDPESDVDELDKGEKTRIQHRGATLGVAVKTYTRANPIYVSIGHQIDLETATELVLLTSEFKMPEALRQAHIISREEVVSGG